MKDEEYEELVAGGKEVFYSAVIVFCCIIGAGASVIIATIIHKLV